MCPVTLPTQKTILKIDSAETQFKIEYFHYLSDLKKCLE